MGWDVLKGCFRWLYEGWLSPRNVTGDGTSSQPTKTSGCTVYKLKRQRIKLFVVALG